MNDILKICVFTGTRAEYGLLRPLLQRIRVDRSFLLQLIVSGTHLEKKYGMTCREIEEDGFSIDERIALDLAENTALGISHSMGIGIRAFAQAYDRLRPDIVIILGDRCETLMAATAALFTHIPIAHIHGGEMTTGVIDDSIRHAITKLSHYHFTSAEAYRKRVIQLGEDPERVFTVGALGIDNIESIPSKSKSQLASELNVAFSDHNLLVTYHPSSLDKDIVKKNFNELLDALEKLNNTTLIFTSANADVGGQLINQMIDAFIKEKRGKAYYFSSLGYEKYLSMMRCVDGVVGNSSSGILEAPSIPVGTVNIGDRQKGRIRAQSVIDVVCEKEAIYEVIQCVFSKEHKEKVRSTVSPYGTGGVAKRIITILKKIATFSAEKKFYDISFTV